MKHLLRTASCVGLAVLLSGCDSSPSPLQAQIRFADPELRSAATSDFGTGWNPEVRHSNGPVPDPGFLVAGIRNDHRYVLAPPPNALLASHPKFVVPADGKVELLPPLPVALQGSTEVILQPSVRVADRWEDLTPSIAVPVEREGTWWVPIRLDLPPSAAGKTIVLNVLGYGLVWGNRTRVETPPVKVPANARLELANGLLNPLKSTTPVVFTVEACEKSECLPLFEKEFRSPPGQGDAPWETARIDLSAFANRDVRFVFRTTANGPEATTRMFPLWANPTVFASPAAPQKSPATNVILISLDTLSARHLDLYGYGQATAPKMKKSFGEEGAVFENCVAAATATAPTHMTMMTGLHPLEHNVTDGFGAVVGKATALASVARAAGIETAAFTEDGWVSVGLGFGRGFGLFHEDRSPNMMAPEGHVANTFGSARKWLAENREKSFFLFLHTFEVHDPYAPPAAYRDLFRSTLSDLAAGTAAEQVDERVAYDQEIRYVDDQLSILLDEIRDLGLEESTLVIVTGDHGEAFGEHGFIMHGNYMYEEVLHVPLLIRGPGVGRGVRVPDVVGHVDVMPTVLEALGLPKPHATLRGTSLLAASSHANAEPLPPNRVLFAESWGTLAVSSARNVTPFLPPALAARRGNLKLTRYRTGDGFRYEGFDLQTDPHERTDLLAKTPETFRELRQHLDRYEQEAASGRESLVHGATESPGTIRLDPDQEEKLRALGYLQ